ncbi:LacI family DNA-binding transcriptional regulator [Cetobacterium somerae]|uniref:LacI family DNA-binding transcriptional regulator n=1 Tax=Cetobacterium somerae TaxID=188913 RepID=UPI001F061E34|nr:LacI family DNA-binding transcriptional regulator [Cetobacterium somerae]MCX3068137.1 LacI family DNA-binding transcriptional regulator [Cetobacterium somerae]UPO97503.1 LacI family transcriptional regulator [Cetobacterium somerae]
MKNKRITMTEIANLVGVSQATVSRAINQPEKVKPELREKIQYFIDKYKFVPNENAKTMRGVGSKILGLIVFSFSNHYYLDMIKYAEKLAREKGYSLLVMNSEKNATLELEHIKMMLARNVEGILITPVDEKNLDFLETTAVPFVALNEEFPGHNYVTTSLTEGGEIAAKHLIANGYKNIGYIGGDNKKYHPKLEGIKKILKENSINFKTNWFIKMDTINLIGNEIDNLFKNKKNICKAYITSNDEVACLFLKKANEFGYKIPEDIALVGFDNTIVSKLLDITSIIQPTEDMVRKGIEILLSGENEKKEILLSPEIEIRKSSLK